MMCTKHFLAAALSLSVAAVTCEALAAAGAGADSSAPPLTVRAGDKQELDLSRPVSAFRIVNPEVLDARAIDTSRVELIGKAPGVSPVVAYDAVGKPVYQRLVRIVRPAARGQAGQSVVVQSGTARVVYNCAGGRCFAPAAVKP